MIEGINIREVWDFRLSSAVPGIDTRSGTWVVSIYAKENPDYDPENPTTLALPLETYDTGIKSVEGDEYDTVKVSVCYEWLKSVRDKYSLDNIEELKPSVANTNKLTASLSRACRGLSPAQAKPKILALRMIDAIELHGEVK